MELYRLLGVQPGVTAVIGGGGKTALLDTLVRELAPGARVILCTTTHIFPSPRLPALDPASPQALAEALAQRPCLCLGTPAAEGKLTAPSLPMAVLAEMADYVLVEADGSRQRPVKAHLSHEPVIPPEAGRTVLVAGASGLGRPVEEAVHRPERFCRLTGAAPEDPVTVQNLAALLREEGLGDMVFLNQTESRAQRDAAARLAGLLDVPVYAGSLRRGEWYAAGT